MTGATGRGRNPALIRVAAGLLIATVLGSCSSDGSPPVVGNLPPQVRLTGGPIEGDRQNYRTRIFWSGWDDDGRVERYEYAVDPPDAFTRDEIAAPEAFPDLILRRIPGPKANQDTLRVLKPVEAGTVSFDYIQTPLTDVTVSFTSPLPDSAYFGSSHRPVDTSSGYHSFYVRALDNEGAWSDIDRVSFTSWSYAPLAYITSPDIGRSEFLVVGEELRITWGGLDPDGPTTEPFPVGYYYKLVDLRKLPRPTSAARTLDAADILYRQSADIPWTYLPGDNREVSLLLAPSDYMFAVRAVDLVGAVEPFVDFVRPDTPGNVFKFVSVLGAGIPTLVITEPSLGTFPITAGLSRYETEVPLGIPLNFTWSASASTYGGKIEAFSYGVDVADEEKEGPGSGWSPWGKLTSTTEPVLFKKPGIHVFYVRVRDSAGKRRVGSVVLSVFDTPLDRELLLVDDYKNSATPLDTDHDAFWERLVANSGRIPEAYQAREYLWYDTGGDRDRFYLDNTPPRYSLIGRYQTTLWIVDGSGWCGNSSLLQAAALTPMLRNYLAIGGKLWIVGPMSSAATLRAAEDCRTPPLPACETTYPITYLPGGFPYDILHLATADIRNDKGTRWEHGMEGVKPWDPDHPVLPEMRADGTKYNPLFWKYHAVERCEAIFEPIFASQAFEVPGKLDSLYSYIAAVGIRPPKDSNLYHSEYDGKLCAARWHDPDPDRAQGRVMWFGFPLYPMFDDQAQETFNRALDWFREEKPSPPAS